MGIIDRIKRIAQSYIADMSDDNPIDVRDDEHDAELRKIIEDLRSDDTRKQHNSRQQSHRPAPSPQQEALSSAYRILGVSPSASVDEIKKAYRNTIRASHPDRAARESPSVQDRAKKKTQEINSAYELLKKIRKF